MRKNFLLFAVLTMAGILMMAPGAAMAKAKYVLKFGHLANEENTWHKAAVKFAELVAEKSGGQIECKIYPSEQLGKEMDLITGIQMGTVDMTITGESMQNWAPLAALMGVPYAIRDMDHLVKVADGPVGTLIEEQIREKIGVRPVGWFARGPRNLTSNKPINSPADLDGMILRVPNVPLFVSVWQALGAKPTPMAFSEVFTSLQQGTIHGQENPYALIKSAGFYEVQKFCNLTEHVRGWIYVVIGDKKFQSMPEELQKVVLEAGKEMQAYERELFLADETALSEWLQGEGGMTFVNSDKAAFQAIAKEAVVKALDAEQNKVYEQILQVK
jgi:tripartite ATP-independent transporter DctP family solute receptor